VTIKIPIAAKITVSNAYGIIIFLLILDEKYFTADCSHPGEIFIIQTIHYLAGKLTNILPGTIKVIGSLRILNPTKLIDFVECRIAYGTGQGL
jgi:hypothetical protein